MTKSDTSYSIGYKRPPRATRFKPGQSGNAKGRPKGSENLSRVLQQELSRHIVVVDNGQRKTITKQQAFITQLVNKAASGDPRSIAILLKAASLAENGAQPADAYEALNKIEDHLVIANIVARIRQMENPPDPVPDKASAASNATESTPRPNIDHSDSDGDINQ